jgi:two-component system chemotaxis response regulator CheB
MRHELFAIVGIGTSLGGFNALRVLFAGLPRTFPLPIAVVQHRRADSDDTLRRLLQQESALPVNDVKDKEVILPGRIYLAPANYHLLIDQGTFALSTEAPVHYARPSIDLLFESAADTYGKRAIGVVLTGASRDGAQGAAAIKARGGLVVVQQPETAESRVMPEAAIAATEVDEVLPLFGIATFLVRLSQNRPAHGYGEDQSYVHSHKRHRRHAVWSESQYPHG